MRSVIKSDVFRLCVKLNEWSDYCFTKRWTRLGLPVGRSAGVHDARSHWAQTYRREPLKSLNAETQAAAQRDASLTRLVGATMLKRDTSD